MNKEMAELLIQKFQKGILTDAENETLEMYLENGWIELEEVEDLQTIHDNLVLEKTEIPTKEMQAVFYQNLENEKQAIAKKSSGSNWWNSLFTPKSSNLNWGFGLAALFVGVLLGNIFKADNSNQIDALASQLQKTQETMMLALLEKESSGDRLKAVKITYEMDDASNQVIDALLKTLNNDENVNVRLAAIEALADFSKNPKVRAGLIQSIQHQNSPMVQLALAELMVYLQDKKSVEAFRELMDKKEIPSEVRKQLNKKIEVLL